MEGLDWDNLLADQVQRLETSFDEEEIHYAILEMDGERSLGPDGFTIAFYKNC